MYKIGDIIDPRADGSYIYMSNRGVLNLDTPSDLDEARKEDNSYINHFSKEQANA
jgi:hypothetical protein